MFVRDHTLKGGIKLTQNIRIGALISGGGTNLQAIIDACRNGKINGKMVFVGSDNPAAAGLNRAQREHIPTFVVDYKSIIRKTGAEMDKTKLPEDFDINDLLAKQNLFGDGVEPSRISCFLESRAIAEAGLLKAMAPYPFDLLVLAGFMRNLTPYIIDRINIERERPRIMNIHPALLPAFAGIDGYGDTFRYGCKVGGCTVHFIDYGEDTGPIIGQQAFSIQPDDTLESIRKKGLKLEWELFPACIQLFAEGRLKVVRQEFDLGKDKKATRRIVVINKSISEDEKLKRSEI
jgi:phosphoribosylglycinamide formyltransferase-1